MDNLQGLLQEAFHTYQLYLQCMKIDIGGVSQLPLLKWPDVAQSAIKYAEALECKNPIDAESTLEIDNFRALLRADLCVTVAGPLEAIYSSTREHITKHLGKPPKSMVLNPEEIYKSPVHYKNRLILAINDLFKTLGTMTGIEYPELNKRL